METEAIKWSVVYPLFGTRHHLELGRKPGVYRIRALLPSGEPMRISRVGGIDDLGVLHIGKSSHLGRRIRTFRQASEGLKAAHHAGKEFYKWDFQKLILRHKLAYDYFVTTTEKEAVRLERLLHEGYRRKFLDRPPLDGTSGQAD